MWLTLAPWVSSSWSCVWLYLLMVLSTTRPKVFFHVLYLRVQSKCLAHSWYSINVEKTKQEICEKLKRLYYPGAAVQLALDSTSADTLWSFMFLSSFRQSDCSETPLSKTSGRTFHLWICPSSHSNANGQNREWPCAYCTFRKWPSAWPQALTQTTIKCDKS